jgi:opacity protein-like surface antigen
MTTPSPFKADTKYHTFLFGPQLSLRLEHITPFVHGLFGVAHEHADLTPSTPGGTASATGFSFAVGGGLDANIASHLAFRLQGDYLHSNLFDPLPSQGNARFSTGLVFRFGD